MQVSLAEGPGVGFLLTLTLSVCGHSSIGMHCVLGTDTEVSGIGFLDVLVFSSLARLPLSTCSGSVVGMDGVAGFSTGPPVLLITDVPRDNNAFSASLYSILSSPITVDVDGMSIESLMHLSC